MKVTMMARAVHGVDDDTLPQDQRTFLDQKVLRLAQEMGPSHPLSSFSPLIDVSRAGQLVGALRRRWRDLGANTLGPLAKIFPWTHTE